MKNLIGFCALLLALPAAAADPEPPKPTSHTERDIQGWTVHLDDRLLKGPDAELGTLAIGLLEGQLRVIALTLPEDKVQRLRKVPIWLDRMHGKLVPAQYHPSPEWLAGNGYSRELAKCVHVPDAKYFAAPRHQREQPSAMLHELAHAYHDQVLDFNNAEIKAAWDGFVKSGKYKKTLHINGSETKHYALTNEKEFFAEMTESYFGRNDFYPFNSGELKREEPEIFKLLEKVWGKLP
ncbi:MAG TPA: hypothetical protein VHR66_22960 [Gemmataceae bacterium]|nr:hypothetical protein [Gemmataceae bacterium]